MEKYAKLMKGLEACAGPDCCKDGCPYYGKTTGAMTCRARLLADASIAINDEMALRESAEEYIASLTEENKTLQERCQVQQNEINALVLKLSKQDDETDRPSALSDDLAKQIGELVAHANYQQGRADTLAEIVRRCSFGGGGRHE